MATKPAPAPVRRSRTRTMSPEATTALDIPEATQLLIRDTFLANQMKNAGTNAEKKLRKELLGEMGKLERDKLDVVVKVPNPKEPGTFKTLALTAEVTTPDRQVVDVAALAKLVSYDVLLTMVSVSQDAVKGTLGEATLAKVLVTVAGTTNVTVGPTK